MNDGLSLIGVDAGTSVVKAVAFDASGSEICASEIPIPLRRPEPLWIEQDMDELWQKVKVAVKTSSIIFDDNKKLSVALSEQM